MAIPLSALTLLNIRRPMRPAGERPSIRGKHDDNRGGSIAQRAEKWAEVRRVDSSSRNEARIDVVSCVGDHDGWKASSRPL